VPFSAAKGMVIKMKKAMALFFSVALIMMLASGCGSNSSSASSGKSNVTLTFGSHQSGLPTTGIIQKIAKEYEEKTGVKIDFSDFTGHTVERYD
jgi:raffinose/stachyose/melibiose transport system substrate-binding protein